MKSRIALAFTLFAFVLLPNLSYAKHIIGGEITYEYIGPGSAANTKKFRFTMHVYRDCNGGGAPFDDPAEFAIYRGTYAANVLFQSFSVPGPEITRLVPEPPPCVSQIPNICVEEAVYVFTRDLPNLVSDGSGNEQSFFIVHQRCCRNESIVNIVNPGDVGATFMVELTARAMSLDNNSPVFTLFPPIIICNNFPLVFDHSATDADGDQLVYSMCSPLNGGGNLLTPPDLYSCAGAQPTPPCSPPFDNVPFVSPTYTPAAPMAGSPVIGINSTTGLISGTPRALKQFVVGVCVQEFRNGQLLSNVKRDFQFNVTDCTPDVYAEIQRDSIVGPKQYVVVSCGEKTVSFINKSVEREKINSWKWEFELPGGLYTDTENWDATVTFPDTGTYFGHLYLNIIPDPTGQFCADTAEITVNIFPGIKADFEYAYDTCVAGPVTFTDKSIGEAGIDIWSWRFGVPDAPPSNEQNPVFNYDIPGMHEVTLWVWDKNRCSDAETKTINYYPAPPTIIVEPNTFLGCAPADVFFNNLSKPIDSTYLIIWDYGDGGRDTGIISPTHPYTVPGIYDVSIKITSPLGCYIEAEYPNWIRVAGSPTAGFACDPDTLLSNLNNTVKFIDQSQDAFRWFYSFGNLGTSTEPSPTFTFRDTGMIRVLQVVTHPSGCQDTLSKILDIRPEIRWFMPNAFTPNGDGQNDGFYGKGFLEGATEFNMTIWNRWGEKIFETNDPTLQWNGRVNNTGGMSPAGVYVYLVTLKDPRGNPLEYRGFATLVK